MGRCRLQQTKVCPCRRHFPIHHGSATPQSVFWFVWFVWCGRKGSCIWQQGGLKFLCSVLLLLSCSAAAFRSRSGVLWLDLTNNKQWRAALLPSLRWLAVGQSGIRRLSGRAYCHAPLQTINALSGCLGALAAGAYVTVVRTSLHPAVCSPVAPSLVMLRREHLCAACVSLLHCAACTVCVHHQKAGGLAAAFGQCAVL